MDECIYISFPCTVCGKRMQCEPHYLCDTVQPAAIAEILMGMGVAASMPSGFCVSNWDSDSECNNSYSGFSDVFSDGLAGAESGEDFAQLGDDY